MSFQIESLSPDHNRQAFDCGEEEQNVFLRRFALRNDAIGFGTVWVAVESGSVDVKGYYTLSGGHIEHGQFPGEKKWPRYPRPFTLIGQLARDVTVRGQQVGEFLLTDALRRALEASKLVGSILVVVDASTAAGCKLYQDFGFEELYTREDGVVRMVRRMSDIEADFEAAKDDGN